MIWNLKIVSMALNDSRTFVLECVHWYVNTKIHFRNSLTDTFCHTAKAIRALFVFNLVEKMFLWLTRGVGNASEKKVNSLNCFKLTRVAKNIVCDFLNWKKSLTRRSCYDFLTSAGHEEVKGVSAKMQLYKNATVKCTLKIIQMKIDFH